MSRLHLSWVGFLGLLGIFGFFSGPFYFVFFMFFGFFWTMPLSSELPDERLKANWSRAASTMTVPLGVLYFVVLYMLQAGVATSVVLTVGSLAFATIVAFMPALTYWIDKRG